jgi:hypothetical protein
MGASAVFGGLKQQEKGSNTVSYHFIDPSSDTRSTFSALQPSSETSVGHPLFHLNLTNINYIILKFIIFVRMKFEEKSVISHLLPPPSTWLCLNMVTRQSDQQTNSNYEIQIIMSA